MTRGVRQTFRATPWFPKRARGQTVLRTLANLLLPIIVLWFLIIVLRSSYQLVRHHLEEARADAALHAAQAAAQRLKSVPDSTGLARCFDSIWAGGEPIDGSCDPVVDFLAKLRAAGLIMPLRDYGQGYNRSGVCAGGCFFAGNLRNAQLVLPNYIYQLAHLVATLSKHGNPTFVSIYESGSNDRTPGWLGVLQDVLSALSVPYELKIGGKITREKGEERIHFLARVRSAAVTPLYQQCSERGIFCAAANNGTSAAATAASGSRGGSGRIVFLNDVLFSSSDVLRLLQYPADLVCGLDLGMAAEPDLSWEEHWTTVTAYLQARWHLPHGIARWLTHMRVLRNRWRRFHREQEPKLREFGPLFFYDKWVARDISGRMFTNRSPYVAYANSIHRVVAGRPVRVHCCWNGLAVITAEPLLAKTLQFREHTEGECSASECSLLCDDMWRLGYDNIVMDPTVRVAYDKAGASRLYKGFTTELPLGAPGLGYAPFRVSDVADVLAQPRHDDLSREERKVDGSHTRHVDCCDLKKGADMVEFRDPGVCHDWTVAIKEGGEGWGL